MILIPVSFNYGSVIISLTLVAGGKIHLKHECTVKPTHREKYRLLD